MSFPAPSLFHAVLELNHYNTWSALNHYYWISAFISKIWTGAPTDGSDEPCYTSNTGFICHLRFPRSELGWHKTTLTLLFLPAASACLHVSWNRGSPGHITAQRIVLCLLYSIVDTEALTKLQHRITEMLMCLKNYRGESLLHYSFYYTSQKGKL